jgi:hypothetical protein
VSTYDDDDQSTSRLSNLFFFTENIKIQSHGDAKFFLLFSVFVRVQVE